MGTTLADLAEAVIARLDEAPGSTQVEVIASVATPSQLSEQELEQSVREAVARRVTTRLYKRAKRPTFSRDDAANESLRRLMSAAAAIERVTRIDIDGKRKPLSNLSRKWYEREKQRLGTTADQVMAEYAFVAATVAAFEEHNKHSWRALPAEERSALSKLAEEAHRVDAVA